MLSMADFRRFLFVFLTSVFISGFGYSATTTGKNKTEYVKIDFRLNTRAPDKKNYFHWKNTTSTYKDSFDAVSGASAKHSTKEFRAISFDTTGKIKQAPKGLRSLFLFAVSPFTLLENDNFTVQADKKKITITFSHRGIDYKIETDEKGLLDVQTAFFIAEPGETKPEAEKKESEAKSSDETDDAPPEVEKTYKQDTSAETAEKEYAGALKVSLSPSGILSITGKLTLSDKKREEPVPSPTPPEQENSENEPNPPQDQ